MFKTFAPKSLEGSDIHEILSHLNATPLQISKFLLVSERTVRRWIAENSAPFAALAALWHETPQGRYETSTDVGNELQIVRRLAEAHENDSKRKTLQIAHILSLHNSGSANDSLIDGPAPALMVDAVTLKVDQNRINAFS